MGKTYRERLIDTLNHRDPGQVVVDLGSTSITGININALVKLRKGLGLEDITPVMDEPLQLLGRVDEDLRQAVGAGVIGVNNGYTIFGYKNRDWKEWTLHNGLKMLVSEEFRTTTDERGNTYLYAQGNTNYPPAGKMPKDGFFFDNITRSDATAEDEDHNAREDYKDDFKVFTDEELRFIQDDVNNIYENTGYGMIYNGALCGVIVAGNLSSADATLGVGYETDTIAAVVIGGVAMSGGEGTIWGSLLGAAIIGILKTAFVLLRISAYWQSIVIGIVIIAAVTIDKVRTGARKA